MLESESYVREQTRVCTAFLLAKAAFTITPDCGISFGQTISNDFIGGIVEANAFSGGVDNNSSVCISKHDVVANHCSCHSYLPI